MNVFFTDRLNIVVFIVYYTSFDVDLIDFLYQKVGPAIQWLEILGDKIFLTLEWQFPVNFYIRFNMGLTPYN